MTRKTSLAKDGGSLESLLPMVGWKHAAVASAAMSPGHGAGYNPAVAPREMEVQIHQALSTGVPSSSMLGGK